MYNNNHLLHLYSAFLGTQSTLYRSGGISSTTTKVQHPPGSNQIKSLLLSHHHSTSALVSEILTSVLQTVQKKQQQQFTYGQYIFTDCTEDKLKTDVQNTHTYTQYTQCTIKTYLVIDPHYTLHVHIYIMYTSIHSIM